MDNFLPNGEILKNPFNWALVAFSLILLFFIFHVFFKDND